MKLRILLMCILAVALLTACSPSVDPGPVEDQPTPTAAVTPSTEPQNTATPVPTILPKSNDTQEDTEFIYFAEGVEYKVPGRRHHSDRGYSMTYDPAIMTFSKNDQYDIYSVKPYDGLPAVKIQITVENRSAEAVAEELKIIGSEQSESVQLDGCEAKVFQYSEGTEQDDVVKTYYVVQAGDTVYRVEICYFNEAAEGYGSRMIQMVNTIGFDNISETPPAPEVTETPVAKELKIMVRDKEVSDFTSAVKEVTTLQAAVNGEAAEGEVQWTSSNEAVCTVTVNDDGTCDVTIKGEGAAKVTAVCGELTASTVVRGIKSWK